MLSLLGSAGVASPVGLRQQNGSMTISAAPPMQQRLASMAAAIHQLIPAAEVRLFGSRAQGKARPDSYVDLLITAPDAWLAQPDLSVDLVLHSRSEVARRALEPGSLVHEALRDGVLFDGQP
jgi:hypothetical protein